MHLCSYKWFYSARDEFCIRLKSSLSNCNAGTRSGDPVRLFHNGVRVATAPEGFKTFDHCIDYDDVDIQNDEFRLKAGGGDRVCITSLHVEYIKDNIVNSKQILVGKNNDLTSFEFDTPGVCLDNKLRTASLTIQDGVVIESECKGMWGFLLSRERLWSRSTTRWILH